MSKPFLTDAGAYRLCPFCATPLSEQLERRRLFRFATEPAGKRSSLPCPVCELDLGDEPPPECYPGSLGGWVECMHCHAEIYSRAVYCHHCKLWQLPPYERSDSRDPVSRRFRRST